MTVPPMDAGHLPRGVQAAPATHARAAWADSARLRAACSSLHPCSCRGRPDRPV